MNTLSLKAREISSKRHTLHENQKSHRPLSTDYEYIGILGELYFAQLHNLEIDEELRADGDKGVDFNIGGVTIDVKTARSPFNLLVEEGKVRSNIYVLAGYEEKNDSIYFVGWTYDYIVKSAKLGRMPGYSILNHIVPKVDLYGMIILPSEIKKYQVQKGLNEIT